MGRSGQVSWIVCGARRLDFIGFPNVVGRLEKGQKANRRAQCVTEIAAESDWRRRSSNKNSPSYPRRLADIR